MTKEELLRKGISEKDADEIIAAFSENPEEEDSLQSLQKALAGDPPVENLHKASGGDDEDPEDQDNKDYDESYMKKNMKRFMKENKKACQKMMKDVGASSEEMHKAIDDIDPEYDGAVVEMTELKPFLDSMKNVVETMSKAMAEINGRVDVVSAQVDQSYDLMKKAAQLQVDQAEVFKGVDKFLSGSQGTKGVFANADMSKAAPVAVNQNQRKIVHSALMKAVKNGDKTAGLVISAFESCGQDINCLKPVHKNYINGLISGEAK
jgi:hypothetical protein